MASQETPSTVFVADEDDAIYEDEAHGKSDGPLFKVQVIEVQACCSRPPPRHDDAHRRERAPTVQVWICVVLLCILLLLLFLVNMSWRIYGQSITSPPKSQGLSHSACASSLPPRLYMPVHHAFRHVSRREEERHTNLCSGAQGA